MRLISFKCVTYRLNWPGELPEDGEMNGVTLPSRHRIRNLRPGGLRQSALPLGHGGSLQYLIIYIVAESTMENQKHVNIAYVQIDICFYCAIAKLYNI